MVPLLRDLAMQHSARVRVVGAGCEAPEDPNFECLPWTEELERNNFHSLRTRVDGMFSKISIASHDQF